MRCLHKQPERRPASMASVAGELAELGGAPRAGLRVTTLGGTAGQRIERPARRRSVLGSLAVVAALGALGLPAARWFSAGSSPREVRVELRSDPPGAEVFRGDGTFVGKTPCWDRLSVEGEAVYRLALEGYLDAVARVPVREGATASVRLTPRPPPPVPPTLMPPIVIPAPVEVAPKPRPRPARPRAEPPPLSEDGTLPF
jgi:hypothetical protein